MTRAPPQTVAVLGTGTMGAPIARNPARAGIGLRVWNRTRAKAEPLADDGAYVAGSPADAVRGAGTVLTVLKDGPAAREAIEAAAPEPGTVWAQISTVGEDVDGLAAFARERGLVYVDAPVQGTRLPAEQGELIVLAAGDPAVRPAVQPLFDAIGSRTVWVGDEPGAASRLKLVLNSRVLALTHGVGEALALAEGIGVDPEDFLDVVSGGPMDNGYLRSTSDVILSGDYTPSFTVDNARKDAALVLAAADRASVRMDIARAGEERLRRASELGQGDEDMAAGYFAGFDGAPPAPRGRREQRRT